MSLKRILIACLLLSQPLWADDPKIDFKLSLDQAFYPHLAEGRFYLQANLKTGFDASIPNRPPLNVCLIIDRSGSMAGERIEYAKEAIYKTIEALSANDVLSVITFGSQAETLIPAQHADRLSGIAPKIQAIEAIGGSALYDALNQAAAQLRRYRSESTLNRIVLLSDGPPTKGPREIDDFAKLAQAFLPENFTISAVGIGDEFNEDLLLSMTRPTGGNYRFATDNAALVSSIVEEVSQLNQVIARDITLDVQFRHSISVKEALLGNAAIDNRSVRVRWNFLFANQDVSAIISGTILADGADDRFGDIASATLRYTSLGDSEEKETTLTATANASFIPSRDISSDSINRPTFRAALALEIAQSIREAIEFSDQGELDKGIKELRSSLRDLRFIDNELDDPVIDQQLQDLQVIYDQLASRGLNRIDRKALTEQIENPTTSGFQDTSGASSNSSR